MTLARSMPVANAKTHDGGNFFILAPEREPFWRFFGSDAFEGSDAAAVPFYQALQLAGRESLSIQLQSTPRYFLPVVQGWGYMIYWIYWIYRDRRVGCA